MKIKHYFLLLLTSSAFLLPSSPAAAKEVRGLVTGVEPDGKKSPLVNASVQWLDTKTGVLTDENGKFTLKAVPGSSTILVTYIGYRKDTVEVNGTDSILKIELLSELTTNTITVTGRQEERQISTAVIKSETITTRGLQKAACCNLSESFQTSPSVDVSFTNAVTGAKQIQLLGLQGVYIQMMNEQVPALRGLQANLGLEYIPGPWMESIQVSKGLASVSTGFESISGQINIEYKKPTDSGPFFFNAYANQLGRFEANATSALKLNDELSTMLFAHASMNQSKFDNNKDGFLDKPLSKQINIMDRWTYNDGSWISQTMLKALYDEKRGGQTGYWDDRSPDLYGMQIISRKFEALTKNGFIFPGETYKSLGTVLMASHYKVESYWDKALYNGEQNSVYAKVVYQSELFDSTHKFNTGLSYSWDNIIENVQPIGKTKPIFEPKMESIPGAFFEYTYTGFDKLTLMGGIRTDFPNIYKTFITPRFHVQYQFDEFNSIRASAGKGYRTSNIHAEEIGMFASSRKMFMDEKLKPEEAWNYGLNTTLQFNLFNMYFDLNSEFYRTEFRNQVIMDMEHSQTEMHIYNLKGKSYSNSFQVDLSTEPIIGLVLTAAYRLNDVKMTIDGKLVDKPFQSREKGFFNVSWSLEDEGWNFDFTAEYNGSGRLTPLDSLPAVNSKSNWGSTFPAFLMLHTQITKRFGNFDAYLGIENITDYTQKETILSWDNPGSDYFESAMVWGPVIGRVIYLGIRYSIQ